MIVLEVDENQHKSYEYECEYIRMINICQALGISTIFIRYNPDSYRDINKKICGPTKNKRKYTLLECIKYANEIPSNFCEVIYLYYDGYNGELRRNILLEYDNSI
jgi:hypothetical protein